MAAAENPTAEPLGSEHARIKREILDCLRSKTKTYRYVLPTQLLAKSINDSLDCRSLQASGNVPGAFDARSIAHDVVVPFDQANHDVLGGSREPYVNNPLRCKAVSARFRARQKNKQDWNKLIRVLDAVEDASDPPFTLRVLDQVLYYICILLEEVRVPYPTPNRLSLPKSLELVNALAQIRSGGDVMEAITAAFFKSLAQKFGCYDEIRRENVNAADVSSGMLADIECWKSNSIVLLAEVKDRSLTLTELLARIEIARAHGISELLFVAQDGLESTNKEQIEARITGEFNSGINIYVTDLIDLITIPLIVLAEDGRVDFVRRIGRELDAGKTAVVHRKEWAELLRNCWSPAADTTA